MILGFDSIKSIFAMTIRTMILVLFNLKTFLFKKSSLSMGELKKSKVFSVILLFTRLLVNKQVFAANIDKEIDNSPSSGDKNDPNSPKWYSFGFASFKSLEMYFAAGCFVVYVISYLTYYAIYRLSK